MAEREAMGEKAQDGKQPHGATRWRWALRALTLLCVLLLPALASAQEEGGEGLRILGVDTSNITPETLEENKQQAKLTIYLGLPPSGGKPVELKPADISLALKDHDLALAEGGLQVLDFKKGSEPIGVMIVFPRTLYYQLFDIHTHVETLVGQLRDVDHVGFLAYGGSTSEALIVNPSDNNIDKLKTQLQGLTFIDQQQPDLYAAVKLAAERLGRQMPAQVEARYLIVISDAQGAHTGTPDGQAMLARGLQALDKAQARPVVIAFPPPSGDIAATAQQALTQISQGGPKGSGLLANAEPSTISGVLEEAVASIFNQQSRVQATLDFDEEFIEGPENYELTVNATVNDEKLSATTTVPWPEISKSWMWLVWYVAIPIGGLVLLVLIVLLIARRRGDEPEPDYEPQMEYAPPPEDQAMCEVCGRVIPEALYGFAGEFCLDGGKPDCPYYQQPDRGRLTINRGSLSGVTFFIKDEITTIGSLIGEQTSVLLRDESVSKKHAAIKVDEGKRYELRDFASTNGTFVNGDRIQRKYLRDGDQLSFGKVDMEFHLK